MMLAQSRKSEISRRHASLRPVAAPIKHLSLAVNGPSKNVISASDRAPRLSQRQLRPNLTKPVAKSLRSSRQRAR